jgi:hypothetical protein
MRIITTTAIAIAGIIAASTARANVTYTFVPTSLNDPFVPAGTNCGANSCAFNGNLSLTFNDTAYQRGYASGSYRAVLAKCYPDTGSTGQACVSSALDDNGLVTGTFGDFGVDRQGINGNSSTSYNISFNSDGSLSGNFEDVDALGDDIFNISGTGNNWNGVALCYNANFSVTPCRAPGYWTDPTSSPGTTNLPIPSSAALFLSALTAFVGITYRKRTLSIG